MKISEVAALTNVSVRTLHYYDQIGLLSPEDVTEAGYRVYSEASLERLQQILFFRELDFPLNEIKEILSSPGYDKEEALLRQRDLLVKKRERIDKLVQLLDNSIKGEKNMSFKEFDKTEIEQARKEYAEEARERWGSTDAYQQYEKKTKGYSKEKWESVMEETNQILKRFAAIRNQDPGSEEAQKLVGEWKDYITATHYDCTKEILASLGLMYTADERFKKNIDQNGEGTAAFMGNAIEIYCSK
ncbi:MAG: MerR family transcriptional regulator [Lachnospiraceae bacterium]|nr:MerR family transcriptional regulator [Lachnospiraceae bacterium]